MIKDTKNMENVTLPKSEWNQLKKVLHKLHEVATETEYINEGEAAALLEISKKTLWNYCYNGKIPMDYYTTGVGGQRFFDKKKLMGLK